MLEVADRILRYSVEDGESELKPPSMVEDAAIALCARAVPQLVDSAIQLPALGLGPHEQAQHGFAQLPGKAAAQRVAGLTRLMSLV